MQRGKNNMKKIKILDIVLLIVKIVLALLILIPLVFCSYNLIGVLAEDLANVGNEGYHSGTLFYLFASHVILLGANDHVIPATGSGGGILNDDDRDALLEAARTLPLQ